MAITENAKAYHEKMFRGYRSKFLETDPEFIEHFDNFAYDEVVNEVSLDDRTAMMSYPAYLLGCQVVAYPGIGRVFPFLHTVNDVLKERGIQLPRPQLPRKTVSKPESRSN